MTSKGTGNDTPQPSKLIDELFGGSNEEDADPFAVLGGGEDSVGEEHDEGEQVGENGTNSPEKIEDFVLDEQPLPSDRVEELGSGIVELPSKSDAITLEEDQEAAPAQPSSGEQVSQTQSLPPDKDFSALLEEFGEPLDDASPLFGEDEGLPNPTSEPDVLDTLHGAEYSPGPHQDESPVVQNAAALVEDSHDSSIFDDIFTQDGPAPYGDQPSDSPVPDLSIENSRIEPDSDFQRDGAGDTSMQSLFSNASDWLADTTMDDSFDIQPNHDHTTPQVRSEELGQANDGKEPVPFEVPQGWFDEAGNWNWYTEEEKEQVRLAMIGAGEQQVSQDVTQDAQVTSHGPPYSPGIGFGQSENAARRTPQPEHSARMPDTSHDAYAPAPTSKAYGLPSNSPTYGSYPSQSSYAPQTSYNIPTAPSQTQATPYNPATTSYDPYAPSSSAQPYASSLKVSSPPTALPPRAGPSHSDRPAQPKRVASNAYDPPFLRPQKSFVRPPSAMSMTPASFAGPSQTLSPPQASPPAPPPSGPPRRSKTPSAAPAFAEPPRRESADSFAGIAQSLNYASTQTNSDAYAPSTNALPPPSPVTQIRPSGDASRPPRNQSYNSFDPPLRPSSAARNRAVAPERVLTPPTLAVSPPPSLLASGPPRGPSRGSARKQSSMFENRPAFESRPPSRSSASGLQTKSPLAFHQGLGSAPKGVDDSEQSSFQHPSQDESDGRDPENYLNHEHERSDQYDFRGDSYTSPSQERSPYHPITSNQSSYQPTYHSHAPEYNNQQENASDQGPPSRSVHESYGQSPYQPTVGLPSAPQANQRSFGLGLQQMGSPTQAESRPIAHDPYGPQSSERQSSNTQDPYGSSNGYQAAYQSSNSASFEAPHSYTPRSQSTLLNPIDSYAPPLMSPSHGSDLGISPPQPSYFQAMNAPSDDSYIPQQVLEQRPVNEDPLGRCTLAARNAPLAVFGFGGVLITAFPALADSDSTTGVGHHRTPSYGYASGRGQLWIRTVSDLASTSALKPNDTPFPGPLVLDPSAVKGAVGDKKKRESVTAYLEARAEEIEKGLPYLKSSVNQARRDEEGKLVLVRLLSAMIAGEGKLSGNDQAEDAVRSALSNTTSSSGPGLPSAIALSPINGQNMHPTTLQAAIPVKANPAQLAELSNMLVNGNKRDAAKYAANAGLWSHALVISSSVDPELWSEIVLRFTTSELGEAPNVAGLKASYAVFSGKTATSVDDLISAASLDGDKDQGQWREVIAAVVFNGKPADLACLDELGARLRQSGFRYPSHVCHLLSPTSPFSDVTAAAFERIIALTQDVRDEDAIIFAEVAEYARSLVSLPKGQEPVFPGLPQLLPYKLQRAWLAAELGDVDQAKRYCTAIESASKLGKNGPSLLSPPLLSSLEDLNERLTGTPSANPARLIGGRKSKAGLGSWIEGRLTKFIAGEEDGSAPPKPATTSKEKDVAGPFSHFSTISPAASGQISRAPSIADLKAGSLGAVGDSSRTSPLMRQGQWGHNPTDQSHETSSASSSYGGDHPHYHPTASTSTPWGANQEIPQEEDGQGGDEGDFINPMASLNLGDRGIAPSDYAPPKNNVSLNDPDDDEDLGFGNTSLSRGRTPKPPAEGAGGSQSTSDSKAAPAEEKQTEASHETQKPQQKGSWLGKWWTKKEGEGGGPIRAKLGEESSMVYDKELKRWVVKGAKGDTSAPATPPPPPRAQTVSPSRAARQDPAARAMSATPPPSQLQGNGPPAPPPGMPRSSTTPMGMAFTEMPDGGIKRMKSSLNESVTAESTTANLAPPGPLGPPGPPGPPGPSRPPSRPATGSSIDDLLSRPPSKRPASAAKKPMRNRYVDVLQTGAEGQN